MCLIDSCDPCTWFGTVERKAAKEHKCAECGRAIAKGEKYFYSSYASDGDFHDNKACGHCHAARGWLERHCGGWVTEALQEELHEHWSEGYRVDGLGRLLGGVRRGWTRRDGSLMRMPVLGQDPSK